MEDADAITDMRPIAAIQNVLREAEVSGVGKPESNALKTSVDKCKRFLSLLNVSNTNSFSPTLSFFHRVSIVQCSASMC